MVSKLYGNMFLWKGSNWKTPVCPFLIFFDPYFLWRSPESCISTARPLAISVLGSRPWLQHLNLQWTLVQGNHQSVQNQGSKWAVHLKWMKWMKSRSFHWISLGKTKRVENYTMKTTTFRYSNTTFMLPIWIFSVATRHHSSMLCHKA